MENKKEVMEAIVMGNNNNMRTIEDLISECSSHQMLYDYLRRISNRNDRIENAKTFWNDIDEERIKSENAKVVADTKKIVEIGQLLDKLKKLLEKE